MHKQVLVLAKDPAIGESLALRLRELGFHTEIAAPADAAVHAASRRHALYVVHLDSLERVERAAGNGAGPVSSILRSHPEAAVVVAADSAHTSVALAALRQGALGRILQPWHQEEIAAVAARAIEAGRLRRENSALRKRL